MSTVDTERIDAACEVWLPGYPRRQCGSVARVRCERDGVSVLACRDCATALQKFRRAFTAEDQ
jgi:hypothetical protein